MTVDVIYVNITSNGLEPKLECCVIEKKKGEDGTTFVAKYVDHTTLSLAYDGEALKIQNINTVATKTIL